MTQEFMAGEDRYTALGIPYPDPETMCKGPCEGVGVYPQFLAGSWLKPTALRLVMDEGDMPTDEEIRRWHEAHDKAQAEHCLIGKECDGWHFITCPDCGGTGKKPPLRHQ